MTIPAILALMLATVAVAPFPPPVVGPVAFDTKFASGPIISIDPDGKALVMNTLAGPLRILIEPSARLLDTEAHPITVKDSLRPGLYVRARVSQGTDPHGILVPAPAVSRDAKGSPTALVVDEKNVAQLRMLKTGRMIDGQWQVVDGLEPGDKLIVQGLMQGFMTVAPGMPVTPTPAKAPATAPAQK